MELNSYWIDEATAAVVAPIHPKLTTRLAWSSKGQKRRFAMSAGISCRGIVDLCPRTYKLISLL
jgi:hypothetical protein